MRRRLQGAAAWVRHDEPADRFLAVMGCPTACADVSAAPPGLTDAVCSQLEAEAWLEDIVKEIEKEVPSPRTER